MVKLIVDFDEDMGFWYFIVTLDDEVVHFRPGFRTDEEARAVGDAWIRQTLGGTLTE